MVKMNGANVKCAAIDAALGIMPFLQNSFHINPFAAPDTRPRRRCPEEKAASETPLPPINTLPRLLLCLDFAQNLGCCLYSCTSKSVAHFV